MKKWILSALMAVTFISTQAMPYEQARDEALFLSDKMAYELNLSMAQYDAVFEINFDYFYRVDRRSDIHGKYWRRRNTDMRYVLSAYQFSRYQNLPYFYRPIEWYDMGLTFRIYNRYYDRRRLYFEFPSIYITYRGGHSYKTKGSYYSGRIYDNGPRPGSFATPPGRGNDSWHNGGGAWNNGQGGSSWHLGNGRTPGNPPAGQPGTNNRGNGQPGSTVTPPNNNGGNGNAGTGNSSSRSGNANTGGVKFGGSRSNANNNGSNNSNAGNTSNSRTNGNTNKQATTSQSNNKAQTGSSSRATSGNSSTAGSTTAGSTTAGSSRSTAGGSRSTAGSSRSTTGSSSTGSQGTGAGTFGGKRK